MNLTIADIDRFDAEFDEIGLQDDDEEMTRLYWRSRSRLRSMNDQFVSTKFQACRDDLDSRSRSDGHASTTNPVAFPTPVKRKISSESMTKTDVRTWILPPSVAATMGATRELVQKKQRTASLNKVNLKPSRSDLRRYAQMYSPAFVRPRLMVTLRVSSEKLKKQMLHEVALEPAQKPNPIVAGLKEQETPRKTPDQERAPETAWGIKPLTFPTLVSSEKLKKQMLHEVALVPAQKPSPIMAGSKEQETPRKTLDKERTPKTVWGIKPLTFPTLSASRKMAAMESPTVLAKKRREDRRRDVGEEGAGGIPDEMLVEKDGMDAAFPNISGQDEAKTHWKVMFGPGKNCQVKASSREKKVPDTFDVAGWYDSTDDDEDDDDDVFKF
ncbi:hypothetical protein B0T18DRAFT_443775 [Schizothecium vesticola]|uniref:Uncharacterized protein n=1 Tax=Schizothecium vesticola TaxID=314040 RepID=A0AA40F5H9_9PEZI|nr:hypothetical protein B0T18DRAFT_443775 [Schizothecium vesticola]